MIKKRFTFADGFKIVAINDNGKIMNSRQVCDKLNELYEKNKELEKENAYLKMEWRMQKKIIASYGKRIDFHNISNQRKEIQKVIDIENSAFEEFLKKQRDDY